MVVTIGIAYDRVRWEEKILAERAESRGVQAKLIDTKVLKLHLDPEELKKNGGFGDLVLQRCVALLRGMHLSTILESAGFVVVNSYDVTTTCGNKVLTTMALARAGVRVPRTLVAFTDEAALDASEMLGYPLVFKPVVGSWGRMVVPIKDRDVAQAVFEMREGSVGPFNQIYYLQEMVKRPPRDIRMVVVGDRVIAASYRYSSSDEWRTNMALGGRSESCPLTPELEEIGLKSAKAVGGGILGVDAMEGPDGIVVHEVNGTVEFKGISSVSKVDIASTIIEYLIDRIRR